MLGKRRSLSHGKRRKKGMEAINEPGLGAFYMQIAWMKKLDNMKKAKKKLKTYPRSRFIWP